MSKLKEAWYCYLNSGRVDLLKETARANASDKELFGQIINQVYDQIIERTTLPMLVAVLVGGSAACAVGYWASAFVHSR